MIYFNFSVALELWLIQHYTVSQENCANLFLSELRRFSSPRLICVTTLPR